MTDDYPIGERAKRFRRLAATARLASAKSEGLVFESYQRLAATWERLADEAEALIIAHAAEVTQNPPEHKEAALKLPDEAPPQTEPEAKG